MITLTRLTGDTFLLNVPFIEQMEARPDTTITLWSGKKIFVKESLTEVKALCEEAYRKMGLVGSIINPERES
ncbi:MULTISPECIES: flagellar FlbD family protein [Sinobaca]|uniref:Flagellar protein FlbD n=1 Tax=Sinobaca qinghaiensis TaxID=342944 RepID=A0A419V5V1_9BACL|nr:MULTISPECIES: flagellar FlbD family protein [Sinobaca]RKD75364.1 flagellar protein FlbD [Sinobaca qinghaiensis]